MKRRATKHRKAILKAFKDNHLLSAGELEQLVAGADQSTIYRNLKRLEADGVLRSVPLDTVTKYELKDMHGEHDHFICNSCETVKAIFVNEKAIKGELPTSSDFSVTVRGTCGECQ